MMSVSLWLLVFIGIMVSSLVGVMLYIKHRLRIIADRLKRLANLLRRVSNG